MNNLIALRKNLRLARILVMFLTGIALLISTDYPRSSTAKNSNPTNYDSQSASRSNRNENVDKLQQAFSSHSTN